MGSYSKRAVQALRVISQWNGIHESVWWTDFNTGKLWVQPHNTKCYSESLYWLKHCTLMCSFPNWKASYRDMFCCYSCHIFCSDMGHRAAASSFTITGNHRRLGHFGAISMTVSQCPLILFFIFFKWPDAKSSPEKHLCMSSGICVAVHPLPDRHATLNRKSGNECSPRRQTDPPPLSRKCSKSSLRSLHLVSILLGLLLVTTACPHHNSVLSMQTRTWWFCNSRWNILSSRCTGSSSRQVMCHAFFASL